MGSRGLGPFENDGAADYLAELEVSPARTIARTLKVIARASAGTYLEVDDGAAGWAACELVALAFGQSDGSAHDDGVLEVSSQVKPGEPLRLLALEALPRIADPKTSELAQLWHEGKEAPQFDAALISLGERLRAASGGPRALPKPRAGDVVVLPAAAASKTLVVLQVIGADEVAVFEGMFDESSAREAVKSRPATRVPASVSELLRRGRLLGNAPLRRDLKGKKLYAFESGALDGYFLATARGGGVHSVDYEEARACDLHRHYRPDDLRSLARGKRLTKRVRSVDEREAELKERNAKEWAKRRQTTTPGPFGDLPFLEDLLKWIEEYGLDNALGGFHREATGAQGYGRPNERSERGPYPFAGLVALWRGTWPDTRAGTKAGARWPAKLALPAAPIKARLAQAFADARSLAEWEITRDAELRLIWEGAPDGGAELRASVASLRKAPEP